jgi:hypothetical protein
MRITTAVRGLLVLCCFCAALLSGLACSGADESTATEVPAVPETAASDGSSPADEPATENPATPTAEEIATSFLEAYGAFDADQAITYLADDANISQLMVAADVEGTLEEFRMWISLMKAEGYKQILHGCEELGGSASSTKLRCTFDYQAIRSDELGLGPFSGSYFELTVRDGEIVEASKTFGIEEFSPQVWEPFRGWVYINYPEDAAIMYTGGGTGARLTEESIRLWDQRSREYAEEVGQTTIGAETSP